MGDTVKILIVISVIVYGTWALMAEANGVKYCKNYQTGKIITVEAGFPCPYPTVEL